MEKFCLYNKQRVVGVLVYWPVGRAQYVTIPIHELRTAKRDHYLFTKTWSIYKTSFCRSWFLITLTERSNWVHKFLNFFELVLIRAGLRFHKNKSEMKLCVPNYGKFIYAWIYEVSLQNHRLLYYTSVQIYIF